MKTLRAVMVFIIGISGLTVQAQEETPAIPSVISQPGRLLFSDDFDSPEPRAEWRPLHGTQWKIVEGVRVGTPSTPEFQAEQIALGNRPHSGKTPSSHLNVGGDKVRGSDFIVQFRFKLSEGLKAAHFGFNDGTFQTGTGHVCRFIASTNAGLAIQKDRNVKQEGDQDEILVTSKFQLKPDTWYWMVLEVVGDTMVAQVSGGPILRASHPRIGHSKDQINLPTRSGGTIHYDNVRVWKAVRKVSADAEKQM